jgi:hypothetical protein
LAAQTPPAHSVPAGETPVPSTHTGWPALQSNFPGTHAVGLVEHALPGLQAVQPPSASHTRPPPQEVPGALSGPSTQWEVSPSQAVTPGAQW